MLELAVLIVIVTLLIAGRKVVKIFAKTAEKRAIAYTGTLNIDTDKQINALIQLREDEKLPTFTVEEACKKLGL